MKSSATFMKKTLQSKSSNKPVDEIISKYQNKPGAILSVLKEIQEKNRHKFLQKETLKYISKKLRIPVSKLYSVATFYAFFNLKPQGKHSIVVCRGTACHTRGSKNILDFVKNLLDIEESESEGQSYTTKDKEFTIKSVACFGQCALAPVVSIDGNIYSHVSTEKVKRIIKKTSNKQK